MKGSSRGYVTSSHHMQIKSEQLQSNSFINPWCCKSKWIAQLCLTLCNPMDYNLPGSSAHGIFQARTLEWVAISLSRGASQPKDQTQVSHIAGRCFTIWATREDLLEKEMATHSRILAWKIPWMVEPGRLRSTGSRQTGLSDFTFYGDAYCLR